MDMTSDKKLGRREFAAMAPALLALANLIPRMAEGQQTTPPVAGPAGKDPKPSQQQLKILSSGTFSPGPGYGSLPKRKSHRYLIGMLTAGNIRLEMHETIQEPGAEHEPVDTHKHNEIWLVQRGVASLFINDVEHRMEAGDVGLVAAGDRHWVKNIGTTELAYFVVTLGPPE